MGKKIGFSLLGILAIFCALSYVLKPKLCTPCAFCDPQVIRYQSFYEEELVEVLYTHKPLAKAHFLVIPKRHVERFEELTSHEMVAMQKALQKVHLAAKKVLGTSSYLLLQKNGVEVGQSVPHVHFHYVGRKEREDGVLSFMAKMVIIPLLPAISADHMSKMVNLIRETMEAV